MSNTHRESRCTCDVFSSAYVGSSAQHRHCGTESNPRSQEAAAALELDPAHVHGSSTAELTVKFFFYSPLISREHFSSPATRPTNASSHLRGSSVCCLYSPVTRNDLSPPIYLSDSV